MAGFGGRRRVDGDKAEEVKVEERKRVEAREGVHQEAVIAVGVLCFSGTPGVWSLAERRWLAQV